METTLIHILVLVFSVVVHECAHGWMAGRLGDPTAREQGRLTLNPIPHVDPLGSIILPLFLSLTGSVIMLGWAKPVPVNPLRLRNPHDDHPKVAAAGPLSNLLLAMVFAILLGLAAGILGLPAHGWETPGLTSSIRSFLLKLCEFGVMINVVLALFNLMPLPPLDGSWILLRFLPPAGAMRLQQMRRHGLFIIVGMLLLLRYTLLGDVLFAGVYAVINSYFKISLAVAALF